MMPYRSENLSLQPYRHWKVKGLAWLAKAAGVQFQIHGVPFGASASGPCRSCERRRDVSANPYHMSFAEKCVECGVIYATSRPCAASDRDISSAQMFRPHYF